MVIANWQTKGITTFNFNPVMFKVLTRTIRSHKYYFDTWISYTPITVSKPKTNIHNPKLPIYKRPKNRKENKPKAMKRSVIHKYQTNRFRLQIEQIANPLFHSVYTPLTCNEKLSSCKEHIAFITMAM